MFKSIPLLLVLAVISGICSHFVVKKREPRPSIFIFLLFSSAFFVASTLVVATHSSFFNAFLTTSLLTLVHLSSLCLSIIVYRVGPWHPLSSYPGPFAARLSKWWTIILFLRHGGRHHKYAELHDKYGPWVRVGPNEISVRLVESIRPIYLNLSRSDAYRAIPAKADTLFTLTDRKAHAARRVPWVKALSGEALHLHAPNANKRATQFIEAMGAPSTPRPIDIGHWFSLLLMDMIGDMAFSGGFETMKAKRDVDGFMETLRIGSVVVGVLGQLPWLKDLVELLPQEGPIAKFHKFANQKVKQARSQSKQSDLSPNILSSIIKGSIPLSDEQAVADASLLIASSVETTSQVMITLIRHVYARPDILSRIRQEIQDTYPEDIDLSDLSALHGLKFLNACVLEALRMVPPAPAGPPRTSGPHGVSIGGHFIPPNTTVHIPTWAMQHHSAYFGNPDIFMPDRWLSSSPLGTGSTARTPCLPHDPAAFIPFSAGFGACPGKQLALQNTKIIALHVFRSLDVDIDSHTDLATFDASYRECGLWMHDPLLVGIKPRCTLHTS